MCCITVCVCVYVLADARGRCSAATQRAQEKLYLSKAFTDVYSSKRYVRLPDVWSTTKSWMKLHRSVLTLRTGQTEVVFLKKKKKVCQGLPRRNLYYFEMTVNWMPISANTVKMSCQVKTAERKCEMRANLKIMLMLT